MVVFIIDTYAWIEYLNGTIKGEILRRLFLNMGNKFITIECCLAELKGYCLKNNLNFDKMQSAVKKNSAIFPVLREHWLDAAEIKSEMRKKFKDFGLIDSILIARQKELNCKIISGEKHFKDLKDVVYIS